MSATRRAHQHDPQDRGVIDDTLAIVEAEFREAGLGERTLRELRAYYQRRRLKRWARKKRATRTGRTAAQVTEKSAQAAAEEPVEKKTPPEEKATPAEAERGASEGTVAMVSKWLRKTRVLG